MISDSTTLALIRDFLKANKPEETTAHDVLMIVTLLAFKAVDHDAHLSQATLANALRCGISTIFRSQARLEQLGWLYTSQNGQQNTKRQSVSVESLPLLNTGRLKVSDTAKRIALSYQTFLQRAGRKKFPKGWLEKQFYSAQRILNDITDPGTACKVLTFAVTDPRFSKQSRKSLYHIVGLAKRWNAIKKGFQESALVRPTPESVETHAATLQ